MSLALALPTRRDEAYRYADLDALGGIWPVAPTQIRVAAGEQGALSIAAQSASADVREIEIVLADGASFDLRVLSTGSAYGRIGVTVTLGKGARFMLGAAQLAGGDQTLEVVTEVRHAEPDAVSRQVVRSVAAGTATVNYLGKVAVARGADGSDGEQSVRAMLLDRTATANARPELEIFADDVQCGHGATSGALDEDLRFYLMARGIPQKEAEALLVQAFVGEAVEGIEHAGLRDALMDNVVAWLRARAG